MFDSLLPDKRERSAYVIPYEEYYERGIRGIIFDIDNTLVMHGAPADERSVELFARLRRIGFKTCLISNNKPPRVAPFAEAVGSDFIPDAGKPARRGYTAAMELMGTDSRSTLFVGDQIFTDVWGANRCRIATVLTDPIDPHEEIQIVLKRFLEKPILFLYARKNGHSS